MNFDPSFSASERAASLTASIVSSYVAKNPISHERLPELIASVHASVTVICRGPIFQETAAPEPAVPIRKSITPDYLICLDDGLKFKSMKRHLSSLGMTPQQYREKWGLPDDYPMAAPNYAATRSRLAKENGLGTKRDK